MVKAKTFNIIADGFQSIIDDERLLFAYVVGIVYCGDNMQNYMKVSSY